MIKYEDTEEEDLNGDMYYDQDANLEPLADKGGCRLWKPGHPMPKPKESGIDVEWTYKEQVLRWPRKQA